jgi:hypothetical protein
MGRRTIFSDSNPLYKQERYFQQNNEIQLEMLEPKNRKTGEAGRNGLLPCSCC